MRAVKRLLVNYRPMIFVILDTRPWSASGKYRPK